MSGDSGDASPNLEALKRECHQLVEAIARRPGAIKLLQGVLPVLRQTVPKLRISL